MIGKVKVKGLVVLGLVIVLAYCAVRTISTAGDHGWKSAAWTGKVELDLDVVFLNIEKFFTKLTDTVYAYDYSYDKSRNPLVRAKMELQTKQRSRSSKKPSTSSQKSQPRLAGLVLDKDPVAIVKVGTRSFSLKRGDYFEGHMVVDIDENGVHLLVDGSIVYIR